MYSQFVYKINALHFQAVNVFVPSSFATIPERIKLKLFWLSGLLLFYLLGSSDIYEFDPKVWELTQLDLRYYSVKLR